MLQLIADRIVYSVLGLPAGDKLAEALDFFIYDSIKIIVLLFCMIAAIGFLRTFLPEETVKQWLVKKKALGNFIAALFGAVTPFCSCSSIPIFLSFVRAGIPLGIGFSFLITSPLINEYLVVLMLGFFGWKITLAYILSGMCLGILCGFLIGRAGLEKYIAGDMLPAAVFTEKCAPYRGIGQRLRFGVHEAVSIVKKLWPWILFGVGIGAFIHNYVPSEAIRSVIARAGAFSVPIATLIGVPMYGSCAAIVPIAVVLFQKGVPLGTALAFMMAVSALSLPEAVMLRRAMKLPLIAVFFAVTVTGIILIGYFINFLQPFVA